MAVRLVWFGALEKQKSVQINALWNRQAVYVCTYVRTQPKEIFLSTPHHAANEEVFFTGANDAQLNQILFQDDKHSSSYTFNQYY